jgi:hypothetical protein
VDHLSGDRAEYSVTASSQPADQDPRSLDRQRVQYDADAPKTILELQLHRCLWLRLAPAVYFQRHAVSVLARDKAREELVAELGNDQNVRLLQNDPQHQLETRNRAIDERVVAIASENLWSRVWDLMDGGYFDNSGFDSSKRGNDVYGRAAQQGEPRSGSEAIHRHAGAPGSHFQRRNCRWILAGRSDRHVVDTPATTPSSIAPASKP